MARAVPPWRCDGERRSGGDERDARAGRGDLDGSSGEPQGRWRSVLKKSSSVAARWARALVLTLPFWPGRAGRSVRPSWRQPAPSVRARPARSVRRTSRRTTVEPTRRVPSIAFTLVNERLCLLTVHAHPDDEASKGAPTLAMYHAEGVHTVLVCCTGGEEGDLQNPALREPGQPFHGLTPEEEKAAPGRAAAARAGPVGRDHRLRRGRHARLPRLGHGRHRARTTTRSRSTRRRHRRGRRPAGRR